MSCNHTGMVYTCVRHHTNSLLAQYDTQHLKCGQSEELRTAQKPTIQSGNISSNLLRCHEQAHKALRKRNGPANDTPQTTCS